MGSEAREAAARARVEALEAEIVELTARLECEREAWSRLRITRETVADVIMDLGEPGTTATVARGPEGVVEPGRNSHLHDSRPTPHQPENSSRLVTS